MLSRTMTAAPKPFMGLVLLVALHCATVKAITVNNNVTIHNTLDTPQVFQIGLTLPAVVSGPTMMGGTVSIQLVDENGDGAAISATAGSAIYNAQIDSSSVSTLLADPFSFSVGAFETDTISSSFGLPGLTTPGPEVSVSIGIQIRFLLSGGDTAEIQSEFVVEPSAGVPESGPTAVLLLSGCAVLALIQRRALPEQRELR